MLENVQKWFDDIFEEPVPTLADLFYFLFFIFGNGAHQITKQAAFPSKNSPQSGKAARESWVELSLLYRKFAVCTVKIMSKYNKIQPVTVG